MKVIRTLCILACFAIPAGAETTQQLASRLVARYGKQVSAVAGVTYSFTHEGTGRLAQAFPPTRGTVKVVPSKSGKGLFDRARIEAVSGAGEKTRTIEVVADGEVVRSLDAKNKRVMSAPLWRNGVDLVNLQYLLPVGIVPQLASLEPSALRYEGEKTIDGTVCAVIEADTQMAHLTLYLGKDDALLYGGVARKPDVWGDGTITMSIRKMKFERVPEAAFRMAIPEGYAEVQYSGNLPALGKPAPDFALTGFDGSRITRDQLAGRVVVLDFWATWCGPCRQSMPGLQRLHERLASKGLTIVGVNVQEQGDARAFIERYGFTYAFASSDGSDIAETYKPNLPMEVVIDRQGRVVEIFVGYFGEESDERLERVVRGLL